MPIAAFLSTSLRGRIPEVKCVNVGVSGEYLSRPKDMTGDTYKIDGMYKGQQIFNLCAAKWEMGSVTHWVATTLTPKPILWKAWPISRDFGSSATEYS